MSVFEEVAEELFGSPSKRGRFGLDFTSKYRDYEGEAMTADQLKRLQEANLYSNGDPNGVRGGHPEYGNLYECLEDVLNEWSSVNILMNGYLNSPDAWGAGTVHVFYDNVENQQEFEEWGVLSFESWMKNEKKGVTPDDSRLTYENERFRYPDSDEHLLMTTDECQFREHEEHGKFLRLWWDD